MSIPPEFLEELRHRLPVSQVVGKHVRLRRQGREYIGLSPFNKEKSPSFTVNDQKQFYHCFSSGKHGDIISFVMEVEGLGFMEAVEALAGQAGLEVPKPSPQEAARAARTMTLHEVCEAACAYFQQQLDRPEHDLVRGYAVKRGLDAGALSRFRLGYAPADRQAMRQTLKEQGFSDELMIEAGLLRAREDSGREPFAFFSHRLLFPVTDRRGRVVAFGGRLLEGEGPKYLNSPDTPLFHKSRLLYNMAGARAATAKGHTVVVVEGYMDVIAMVQAGFEAAVAPLGTALTEEQIVEAWRLAGPSGAAPILCFDGDAAGQRAAFRAIERILPHLQPDRTVRFATLPAGEDPDSLLKVGGRAQLMGVLEQAVPLVDRLWQMELAARDLSTPEAWAGLQSALGERAGTIQHAELRRFYSEDLNNRVRQASWDQRRQTGRSRAAGGGFGRRGKPAGGALGGAVAPRPPRPVRRHDLPARLVLATVLNHPRLIEAVETELCMLEFADADFAGLRDAVLDYWSADPALDREHLHHHLKQDDWMMVFERLMTGPGVALVSFVRASADADDARRGMNEAMAAIQQHAMSHELTRSARQLPGLSDDDEAVLRWRSLYREVDRTRNPEAAADDEDRGLAGDQTGVPGTHEG